MQVRNRHLGRQNRLYIKRKQMKQKGNDIITRNFFRLIRSGAFNEYEPIERMSDFKWRRLLGIVMCQNVVAITVNGIRNSQYDNAGNIPRYIVDEFFELQNRCNAATTVSIPQSAMCNIWLNKRLKRIREEEHRAAEKSTETLDMLNIIIYNTNKLLTNGICFGNIVLIGRYLRSRGDKLDFVKLERWLDQLQLKNIAQFEGNILISTLHFDKDEVPFVHRSNPTAHKRALASLCIAQRNIPEKEQASGVGGGLLHDNATASRRNTWNKWKYLRYAPVETASHFMRNLTNIITKIEE